MARAWIIAALVAALVALAPAARAGHEPAGLPATEAQRIAVEDLLRRMTVAVAAADAETYLALVDRRDPYFAREQAEWAEDLARRPAAHFALSLEGALVQGERSVLEGELRTTWRTETAAGDRTTAFPARFVPGELGYLYAGERWRRLEGGGAVVMFEDDRGEEIARRVIALFPEVRAHVHEGFEVGPDAPLARRPQPIKLYATMAHLQHSIALGYTDALSGWNEPGESIKILPGQRESDAGLKGLLAHEYAHVATFELGPVATDAAWWALEGVAELASQRYTRSWPRTARVVEGWARRGRLKDWTLLEDFRGEAARHQSHVYTQGHHMVAFITERHGRHARNAWLRELGQGRSVDEASRAAFGEPFAELDAAWRATLPTEAPAEPDDAKPEDNADE